MRKIRYGVFETASSSVHSMIMCLDEEYQQLVEGNLMIAGWEYQAGKEQELVPRAEVEEWFENVYYPEHKEEIDADYCLPGLGDGDIDYDNVLADLDIAYTLENYGYDRYEQFEDSFTTPSGEKVHAFGYYGNDW